MGIPSSLFQMKSEEDFNKQMLLSYNGAVRILYWKWIELI